MTLKHRCLTNRGYILQRKRLTEKQQIKICRDLTVKPIVLPAFRSMVSKPKQFKVYQEDEEHIIVPRYYGEKTFGPAKYVAYRDPENINIKVPFDPLPHQIKAFKNIQELFKGADPELGTGGLLSLPCGYGKTFLAIKTISILKLKTIILVNKEFLMDQWADSFGRFSNAKVGFIQRDKIDYVGKDVVIVMLHSLALKDYDANIFHGFGLMIIDECHNVATEFFSQALMKCRPKYTLGLSATPERKDGLTFVIEYFLGNLFHRERRSGDNKVLVKSIKLKSSSPYYEKIYMNNGVLSTASMTTQIADFNARNTLLIDIIAVLEKVCRKILFLSSRKSGHLHKIKDKLDEAHIKDGGGKYITYGFYYGKQGIGKRQHRQMLDDSSKCDVVLGIDAIAQEGLDIPSLNTLIFSTPPGMDVEQAVGRILRKYHEKTPPLLVDLIDSTGNYANHFRCRKKFYESEGYQIHSFDIDLDSYESDRVEVLKSLEEYLLNLGEPVAKKTKVTKTKSKSKTKTNTSGSNNVGGATGDLDVSECLI